MGIYGKPTRNLHFPSTLTSTRIKMKLAILCLVLALLVAIEAAPKEAEQEKEMTVRDACPPNGCQPYPDGILIQMKKHLRRNLNQPWRLWARLEKTETLRQLLLRRKKRGGKARSN